MKKYNITKYVKLSLVILFSSAVLGYTKPGFFLGGEGEVLDELSTQYSFLADLSQFEIFLFIFFNNSIKALISILIGFLFGLYPIIFLAINGVVIGAVVAEVARKTGIATAIVGILPHGIFEIWAVILATAYGMWLGVKFVRKIRFNESFLMYLKYALVKYFRIVLPLLLLAAIIETYLTSYLFGFLK